MSQQKIVRLLGLSKCGGGGVMICTFEKNLHLSIWFSLFSTLLVVLFEL